LLRRCLKRSAPRWSSEEASVQVIEFSYVFPVAVLTVIALLYLVFALFFYVYAFNTAEVTTEQAMHNIGGTRLYWQLAGDSVDAEEEGELAGDLQDRMDRIAVIPGISFATSLSEQSHGTKILATVSCTYMGKSLFEVRSERDLRKPTEYAHNIDLLESVLDDTGITKKIESLFGKYLQRNKTYEVF